jgi:hypothetical protein
LLFTKISAAIFIEQIWRLFSEKGSDMYAIGIAAHDTMMTQRWRRHCHAARFDVCGKVRSNAALLSQGSVLTAKVIISL